jgi:TolB-like protein
LENALAAWHAIALDPVESAPDALVPIAVMLLRNVSENSANDYFADGLTDDYPQSLDHRWAGGPLRNLLVCF